MMIILYNTTTCYFWKPKFSIIKVYAINGIRTQIYYLEGNNANIYTTDAVNNGLLCCRKF